MKFKLFLLTILVSISLIGCKNDSNSQLSEANTSLAETASTSSEQILTTIEDPETVALTNKYKQYQSINEVIDALIQKYGLPRDRLGIAYQNYITGESYNLNENQAFNAASTNKVGTAVLYVDLIDAGILTWKSQLPASEYDFQAGGGLITNNPILSSYSLEELIANLLIYSDNTAWNILINYYINNFGNFQTDLILNSGASQISDELFNNFNYATPNVLLSYLNQLASDQKYQPLIDYMKEAQPDQRFKLYVKEGMATKYGQLDYFYHDTSIFYENNQAIYALVLMTDGVGIVDEFMGELNLSINEWYHYQQSLNN